MISPPPGKTGAQGATAANPLVNIQDFYASQVLPELQSAKINENPMLKADAIKFVTTFRSIFPLPPSPLTPSQ